MSIEAQALRKKVGKVTCDPAVRAILGSLLLYITHHEDGPQGPPPAEGAESQVSQKPEPQDASRRLTHFQLLRAKFMGTGREHCLKKTREVGRLIFKDKQGPSRSLVTATINKLLEKTREGADNSAGGQEPFCSDKPRWGLPSGKNTVKNILKKFLAAEEKEAEEKRLRETSPAERPKAARGLLPKIMGKKGSVLSKLREKFEQSSCLCSEASVLLLHTEDRKKKNLQRKKMHRPETRVLCTTTLASTCIRMPLARLLACSAEPMPAFSIATVVCGPRSWLSHCAKLKHSELRRVPPKEAGRPPTAEETVPGGNKTPGQELFNGGPSPSLIQQAAVPSLATVSARAGPECMPEPASSAASQGGEPLPGPEPKLSSLEPASPGHAGVLGGDRMGGPQAGSSTDDTQGSKRAGAGVCPGPTGEGAEEAPQVDLMVCSSEEETERMSSDSEQDPLFAVQKSFPEQKVPEHIPPLHVPAAQAARCTQLALEPPQVTVRLPVVHEMPLLPVTLQKTSDSADQPAPVSGGERVVGNAQALFPTVTESRSANVAAMGVSEAVGTPGGLSTPPQQDSAAGLSLAPLRGAASVDGAIPEAAQTPKPQTGPPGGKEDQGSFGDSNTLENHKDVSGQGVSELSYERHPLPASEEMRVREEGTPSHDSTASETRPGGDSRSAPGGQQEPSPSEGDWTGIPTLLVAPVRDWTRSTSVTTVDKNILCEQEEHRGAPLTESAQPLLMASHDRGEDRPTSLNEGPNLSIKTPRQGTTTGFTKSHTTSAPGNTVNPENDTPEKWSALCKGDFSSLPTAPRLVAEGLGHELNQHLVSAPSGPVKRPSSSAAEGHVGEDSGRHLPVTLGSLTALPQEAAGPQLAPDEPGLGVANAPAANTASATAGSRNTAAERAGPWGNNAKSPVPTSNHRTLQGGGVERPPHHSVDSPPLSSEEPQAKDKEHIMSEKQLPLGAGVSHQFPSVSSTVAEGAPQKCPDLQAHLLIQSRTQTAVVEETEVGERPWAQAGLRGGEEGVSGPVGPRGPGQKGGVAPSDPEKIRPGERSWAQAGLGGGEEGVSGPVGPRGPGQKGVAPSDPEKIRPGEGPWAQAQAGLGGGEEGVSGPVGLKGPGQKGVAPSDPEKIRPGERPWAQAQAGLGGGEEGVSGPVGPKGPGQKGVAPSDPEKIRPGERPWAQAQAGMEGGEEGVSGPVGSKGPGQKGVPPSNQKTALFDSEEAQTQPWDDMEGGDTVTTEVKTPYQHAEKGPEHPPGQWVQTVEDPSEQHGVPTEERQGRPAQAQASRTAPQNLAQPTGNSTVLAPITGASGKSQRSAPTGSQGAPGAPQKEGEHHPEVTKSYMASRPEPAPGSPVPMPEPGDCRMPSAPAQEGLPDISRAGRDTLGLEHQRRSSHHAKYKAQSFSDQRSFDSFRTKIIRANDTFELPK
ncbi:collagen alpha-1(III) chain [Molossus molossus]|uniref:collagen alpha-1(III) chain n=1 Tax=Molossus molossus TaxID=27622 RepID=UPI0017478281|nr:collagen alpha-1(III) chain [Molossus molossus]